MTPISHEKARQYLHLRREGLEAGQRQAMEAHLFVCEECRRYGRNLRLLEIELRSSLHEHFDPVPIPVGLGGKVRDQLEKANQNRRIDRLSGFLVGGLALVVLLGVFFFLFSMNPMPGVTPTPFPPGTERVLLSDNVTVDATGQPSPFPSTARSGVGQTRIPGGRLIAFTSRRDGNEEIYVVDAGGSDPLNLTDHPSADYLPTWSPDGQQLAFVSDRTGKPEVYIMGWDGSGLAQITDLPNVSGFPSISWSPDGSQLAAQALLTDSVTGEQYGRIYLVQADGSGVLDLTRDEFPLRASDPRWSPDGEWVAYVRGGQAPRYLRRVRPDGSGDTQLNLSARNSRAFAWSPDGTRLAYITSCAYCELYDDDPPDLRLVNLNGSEPETIQRFDNLSLDFFNLSWSPDGSYLALTANEGEDSICHLYLLPADGGEMLDVAAFEPGDWFLSFLSWSPDGSRLVFDAGREEERDIYLADLDTRQRGEVGMGVTNLTPGSPGMDYQPQWQP